MSSGRYESSEGGYSGSAIAFLLIGLGVGAVAALVLAPKTGKQFRKDLRRGYKDARGTLEDWAEDARDRTREMADKMRDVADRGASFAEELRERAEPLRRAVRR